MLSIQGVDYFSATEIQSELGVSRQTFWRWRHHGKIPTGYRYRNRQLLFTETEREQIREFANRLEPATLNESFQMKLFTRTLAE